MEISDLSQLHIRLKKTIESLTTASKIDTAKDMMPSLLEATKQANLLHTLVSSVKLRHLDGINVSRTITFLLNSLNGVINHVERTKRPDRKEVVNQINANISHVTSFYNTIDARYTKAKSFGFDDVQIETDDPSETANSIIASFGSLSEMANHIFSKGAVEERIKKEVLDKDTVLAAITSEGIESFMVDAAIEIKNQLHKAGLGTKVPYTFVEGPVLLLTRQPISEALLNRSGMRWSYLSDARAVSFKTEKVSIDKMRESKIRVAQRQTSNLIVLHNQKLLALPSDEKTTFIQLEKSVYAKKMKDGSRRTDLSIEQIVNVLNMKTHKRWIDLIREIPGAIATDNKGRPIPQDKEFHTLFTKNVSAKFVWLIDAATYNKLGSITLEKVSLLF